VFLHPRAAKEVLAIEAVHGVQHILAVPDERAEHDVVVLLIIAAQVLQLAVIAKIAVRTVLTIFSNACVCAITGVLERVAVCAVFALPELVTCDILALHLLCESMGDCGVQLLNIRFHKFQVLFKFSDL